MPEVPLAVAPLAPLTRPSNHGTRAQHPLQTLARHSIVFPVSIVATWAVVLHTFPFCTPEMMGTMGFEKWDKNHWHYPMIFFFRSPCMDQRGLHSLVYGKAT